MHLRHAGRRYNDMICSMKRRKDEVQPRSVSDEGWAIFKTYWEDQETKAKVEKMSRNRNSEVAGIGTGPSKHVGGSRSARVHANALENEFERQLTFYELLRKTHVKKDGLGFYDEKSKKIAEEVEARQIASQETESGGSVNPNQIFLDVVGVKKQRVYDIGEVASLYTSNNPQSSSSSQSENEALRRQVETLSAQLAVERATRTEREEQHARVNLKLQQRLAQTNLAMEERLASATAELMRKIEELRRPPPS